MGQEGKAWNVKTFNAWFEALDSRLKYHKCGTEFNEDLHLKTLNSVISVSPCWGSELAWSGWSGERADRDQCGVWGRGVLGVAEHRDQHFNVRHHHGQEVDIFTLVNKTNIKNLFMKCNWWRQRRLAKIRKDYAKRIIWCRRSGLLSFSA